MDQKLLDIQQRVDRAYKISHFNLDNDEILLHKMWNGILNNLEVLQDISKNLIPHHTLWIWEKWKCIETSKGGIGGKEWSKKSLILLKNVTCVRGKDEA